MSYAPEVFDKAKRELNSRRISAKTTADRHYEEIEKKVPEIAEIISQLASTSIALSNLILKDKNNFQENFNKIRENNIQGQQMIKELLIANGYSTDFLDVKYRCSMCDDTGFVDGKRCDCFNDLLGKYAVEELNANSQVNLYSFDSFSLNYYPNQEINGINCYFKMKENFDYCKNYANSFSLNSHSIFMLGMTGLGKTHLSLSIAKTVIEKGYNVAYDSIVNYLRLIEKEHFSRTNPDVDTLQLILSTDLLILDDLGSEFESSFYTSTIYNIINTRLNKGLPTVISSNFSSAELQKRYDDRIISRLLTMYDYLRFVGNDIRQMKRLSGQS
ncbi:MAG: ATP-binding protein [Oscillospiraceae bacterium]